mmetsp:Transcript_24390/g.51110  ORF Transcript_24390/g.51110 Transcript_24390/m.51110 type:complete len:705 (+) Transcript_24390:46-2160(+)
MSDSDGSSSQDEVLPPHQQLETCLNDLFQVPTKNIESAFELVLGLIKEQSSKIDCLKRAHADVLKDSDNNRAATQNAVDKLAREKDELSVEFQELTKKYDSLQQCHDKTRNIVDGMRHEIETLTFNFLGENDGADQASVDADIETEGSQDMVGNENTNEDDNSKCEEQPLGFDHDGHIGLGEVRIFNVKLTADRTVVARLNQLEQSISSVVESLSSTKQPNDQPTDETLEEFAGRIHAVETFLHGFERDALSSAEKRISEKEEAEEEANSDDENNSIPQESAPVEVILREEDRADRNNSVNDDRNRSKSREPSRRGTLLSLLHEQETRTGLTLDDLSEQINALRDQQLDQPLGVDTEEIQKQVSELSVQLQKQVSDLVVSVSNKVSSEDFESKMQDMRSILSDCDAAGTAIVSSTSNDETLKHISKLEAAKLDKDAFEQQVEQMERDLKSLLQQEIEKQQLHISANAEKTDVELLEIKSVINSQQDAILHLTTEIPMSSSMDSSMKEEEVDARIQQASDDLRASLEDRLNDLKSIEREFDGFASKLAEKPSQDQIDSMLSDLERRLGQDETLQIILANMKIELKQRMTKSEVMALVKHTFKEAKLGIQNTKDTMMIGRIAYCLGCSQPYPSGVNGTRAPKMNHDSLPPALGLVSNATIYGTGSRRSLRPLQTLRSAPQRSRPKSAILGRFSASSAHVRHRNNSR